MTFTMKLLRKICLESKLLRSTRVVITHQDKTQGKQKFRRIRKSTQEKGQIIREVNR